MRYNKVNYIPPTEEQLKIRDLQEKWHDENIGQSGFGDYTDPPSLR